MGQEKFRTCWSRSSTEVWSSLECWAQCSRRDDWLKLPTLVNLSPARCGKAQHAEAGCMRPAASQSTELFALSGPLEAFESKRSTRGFAPSKT